VFVENDSAGKRRHDPLHRLLVLFGLSIFMTSRRIKSVNGTFS
jgi:hypothetical protein